MYALFSSFLPTMSPLLIVNWVTTRLFLSNIYAAVMAWIVGTDADAYYYFCRFSTVLRSLSLFSLTVLVHKNCTDDFLNSKNWKALLRFVYSQISGTYPESTFQLTVFSKINALFIAIIWSKRTHWSFWKASKDKTGNCQGVISS